MNKQVKINHIKHTQSCIRILFDNRTALLSQKLIRFQISDGHEKHSLHQTHTGWNSKHWHQEHLVKMRRMGLIRQKLKVEKSWWLSLDGGARGATSTQESLILLVKKLIIESHKLHPSQALYHPSSTRIHRQTNSFKFKFLPFIN